MSIPSALEIAVSAADYMVPTVTRPVSRHRLISLVASGYPIVGASIVVVSLILKNRNNTEALGPGKKWPNPSINRQSGEGRDEDASGKIIASEGK